MELILPDPDFQLCHRDSRLGFLEASLVFRRPVDSEDALRPRRRFASKTLSMSKAGPTLVLVAFACWSTPCTIAAAETRCVSFSDSIDGIDKNHAVEKSLKSLNEQVEKWKADNGVTGSATVTAEKPQPHPFWRSTVPSYALLPPDVVSDSAYTICWTGVVSPAVCTSGTRVCW